MPKYKVRWNYESRSWNGDIIMLRKGEVMELEEAVAEWVIKDSPGVLHRLSSEDQPRLVDIPPNDRMVKGARKR